MENDISMLTLPKTYQEHYLQENPGGCTVGNSVS